MSVLAEGRAADLGELGLGEMVGGAGALFVVAELFRHAAERGDAAEDGLSAVDDRAVVAAVVAAGLHPRPVVDAGQVALHLIDGHGVPVADGHRRGEGGVVAPDRLHGIAAAAVRGEEVEQQQVVRHAVAAVAEDADVAGVLAGDREGVEVLRSGIRFAERAPETVAAIAERIPGQEPVLAGDICPEFGGEVVP